MNNNSIIAQLDDLQISARLAKVCTTHSYGLHFWEKAGVFPNHGFKNILIIQLNGLTEKELGEMSILKEQENLTIIGFSENLDKNIIKYFKKWGCHMVVRRQDLLKNLDSLIDKIFHAP